MANFDDRLDDAINRMMAGKTLPEDAELRDLLMPAQALMNASVPAPSQRTARVRMNAALDAQRQRGLFGFLPPWLKVGQLATAVIAAAMVVVVVLAGMALPGQPLYPLKQGSEAVLERVQRSPEEQARYYVRMANRRLGEMERLVSTGRPVPAQELAQFRSDWEKAIAIPGVAPSLWQQDALDQAQRLNALIPALPPDLREDARDLVNWLVGLSGRDALPPLPATPSPASMTPSSEDEPLVPPPAATVTATPTPAAGTPTVTPTATATPTRTPTPIGGRTHTPSPTRGPTQTPGGPTATPKPTHTHTPGPTNPPPHATDTPEPTDTPQHTPTHTIEPTHTPKPTHTPGPTRTPDDDDDDEDDKTPEPSKTPDGGDKDGKNGHSSRGLPRYFLSQAVV